MGLKFRSRGKKMYMFVYCPFHIKLKMALIWAKTIVDSYIEWSIMNVAICEVLINWWMSQKDNSIRNGDSLNLQRSLLINRKKIFLLVCETWDLDIRFLSDNFTLRKRAKTSRITHDNRNLSVPLSNSISSILVSGNKRNCHVFSSHSHQEVAIELSSHNTKPFC